MDAVTIDRNNADWIIPLAHSSIRGEGLSGEKPRDRFWIVAALGGSGIVEAGGRRLVFSAPAVFCLNEEENFSIVEDRGLEMRILSFHPCFINSSFDFRNVRGGGAGLPVTSSQDLFWFAPFIDREIDGVSAKAGCMEIGPLMAQRIAKLVDAIAGQVDYQPDSWPCRSRSYLIELLFLMQRMYADTDAKDSPRFAESAGRMDKVILYLHENFDRKVTIDELASAFNTNRTTLMSEFREAIGTSIKDYLIGVRIRFAASLIRDTTLPLSEITERSGFNDFPHFSRTFRERMGCSPSDYRQQNCWMLAMYPDFRD